MPTLEEQFSDAIETLRRQVQAAVAPVLDDPDELNALLNQSLRASFWTAATLYSYGDVILPTARNGHRYFCTQGGTSGATEPTWPTGQGDTASDGSSSPLLEWREDGPDYKNVYNVQKATHLGWKLKAAKASVGFDIALGGGTLYQSQLYKHCMEMAAKYVPVEIA